MMPPEWATAATLLQQLQGTIFVTVHPEHVARAALETVGFVVAVGVDPAATLRSICGGLGEDSPEMRNGQIERGLAYLWERRERRLRRVRINEPRRHLRRHTRKYAEGKLGEDRSFYFRGTAGLNSISRNGTKQQDSTMVVFPRRPGGQSQFSAYVNLLEVKSRPDIGELQAWILGTRERISAYPPWRIAWS